MSETKLAVSTHGTPRVSQQQCQGDCDRELWGRTLVMMTVVAAAE
jgi:hypothetical protein